jgi:GT2 family glycosyltransferase
VAAPKAPVQGDIHRAPISVGEVGIVVIGRNEGARLLACLASLQGLGCPVVYVDSGSTDGSVERARPLCDRVVALDPARLFSAARARNEGFAALTSLHAGIGAVQFLDGDCTLLPGWLAAASQAMSLDPRRAVVIGPLQERRPEASVYNRLCAMEWRSPAGELAHFGALGGIMFVRAEVFAALGGFNEQVIAGEDAEFGVRVGSAGRKVVKIDVPMATHDADIHRFGQWWRRARRSGHAIGQRFSLHGRGPVGDCARERRSVLLWGCALPAAIVLLAPFTHGLSLLLAAGYLVLGRRVARYRRAQGDSPADARLYARFVVIGKFAEGLGLLQFHWNRFVGRYRIIEYK